jgi:hypothetical protein
VEGWLTGRTPSELAMSTMASSFLLSLKPRSLATGIEEGIDRRHQINALCEASGGFAGGSPAPPVGNLPLASASSGIATKSPPISLLTWFAKHRHHQP